MQGLGNKNKNNKEKNQELNDGNYEPDDGGKDDDSNYGDVDVADYDWSTDVKNFSTSDFDLEHMSKVDIENWWSTVKFDYRSNVEEEQEQRIDPDTLNEKQSILYRTLVQHIRNRMNDPDEPPIYLDLAGRAGCGKTYSLRCLVQKIKEMAPHQIISTCAPTGTATTLLPRGSKTIHDLLKLPVNRSVKKPLDPLSIAPLRELQHRFASVLLLVIDEKSMISFDMLFMIDQRLREAFPHKADQVFGNCSLLLMGDFGQLCPVLAAPLYDKQPNSKIENQYLNMGFHAFRKFDMAFTLNQSERQAGEENETFRDILDSLYSGSFDDKHWKILKANNSYNQFSKEKQKEFDDKAVLLSARKVDMIQFNKSKMKKLKQPIAYLRAVHNQEGAAHLSSDKAGGLQKDLWICKGSRIVLTQNLWTEKKLVNGSIGKVEGILYWNDEKPPSLPIILCTFEEYMGPTFVPGMPKCVPIIPKERTFFHRGKPVSRTMIPLLLGWGITIHKSQGMTMDKIFINLGPSEFSAGLTYTAMSRIKSLDNLGFKGVPDLCRLLNIAEGKYFKMRQEYEKKVRPPLEEKFLEYSNRILSNATEESQSSVDEESGSGTEEEINGSTEEE